MTASLLSHPCQETRGHRIPDKLHSVEVCANSVLFINVWHNFLPYFKPVFFRHWSPTATSLQGLADTKIPRAGTPVSIRSSRSMSVLRIPSRRPISQAQSHGSLHRSASQLTGIQDKKASTDDSLWETVMGHDSGLVSPFPHPEP